VGGEGERSYGDEHIDRVGSRKGHLLVF
jgi:hypothetical protein